MNRDEYLEKMMNLDKQFAMAPDQIRSIAENGDTSQITCTMLSVHAHLIALQIGFYSVEIRDEMIKAVSETARETALKLYGSTSMYEKYSNEDIEREIKARGLDKELAELLKRGK